MAKVKRRTWINKDGSKGQSWSVDYFDSSNTRVIKSGFGTKAEAENYLANIRMELEKGNCINKNKQLTFNAIAESFMENYAVSYCRTSTVNGYRGYLKNHLIPYFNNRKAVEIRGIPKSNKILVLSCSSSIQLPPISFVPL